MRVFVDANVLFSAAYSPQGAAAALLQHGRSKGLHLVTCAYAAEEARRNLCLKAPEAAVRLDALLARCAQVPTFLRGPVPSGLPTKDHPIWVSAIESGCDVLLTGDKKDFGRLTHAKMVVMGPAKLFDAVF